MKKMREGIWRFSDRLPAVEERCKQTLGEGGTTLLRLHGSKIWVKVDCINPTGARATQRKFPVQETFESAKDFLYLLNVY